MKRFNLHLITAVVSLALFSLVLGQEKWNEYRGRKGKALEYREVESREQGEEVGEIAMGKRSQKMKGDIRYSVIRERTGEGSFQNREIRFYDEKQNVTFTKSLTNRTLRMRSDQGQYVIIQTLIKEAEGQSEHYKMQYELFNSRGRLLWTKYQPVHNEGMDNIYYISDCDGSVVEVNDYEGSLIFYNPGGDTIKVVDLFETIELSLGNRIIDCKFTIDGQYLVAGITDAKGEIFSSKSGIILFDRWGTERWKFQADESMAYRIYLSPDSRYILSYHRNRRIAEGKKDAMYLLNMNGTLIKRYPETSAVAIFSTDGKYALMNTGLHFELLETETGEILNVQNVQGGLQRVTSGPKVIYDADISSEMKLIGIVKAEERYVDVVEDGYESVKVEMVNPEIEVYHFNGVLAWSKPFLDQNIFGYKLGFSFEDEGREILTRVGNNIKKYRLVNPE